MFCLLDDRQKSHHRCANKNIYLSILSLVLSWGQWRFSFLGASCSQSFVQIDVYDWHRCFEWYKDADFRGSRTWAAYFCLSTAQTWWLRMLVFIYSARCFSHLYKVDTKSFFIHLSCLCRSTPHQPSQDQDHCPVVHLCAFCSDELWRGFWFVKQDQTMMTIALLYCWAELWLDLLVGSRSKCRDIDSGSGVKSPGGIIIPGSQSIMQSAAIVRLGLSGAVLTPCQCHPSVPEVILWQRNHFDIGIIIIDRM